MNRFLDRCWDTRPGRAALLGIFLAIGVLTIAIVMALNTFFTQIVGLSNGWSSIVTVAIMWLPWVLAFIFSAKGKKNDD